MNNTPRSLRDRNCRQRGISLIEACVVLSVTAIVAAIAAPALKEVLDRRRLEGAAAQLVTDIHFARSESVARNQPLRLSVHAIAAGSCYVIHSGGAGQCRCEAAGPARCGDGAREIRSVALASADGVGLQTNVGSILFDPLHGTSSPTGTLRLLGAGNRAVHHVVNVMGRVRSCSPQALMPGYPAC